MIFKTFENTSGVLQAAAYDKKTAELFLKFNNGTVRKYSDVQEDVAQEFVSDHAGVAWSVGKSFNAYRGFYKSEEAQWPEEQKEEEDKDSNLSITIEVSSDLVKIVNDTLDKLNKLLKV